MHIARALPTPSRILDAAADRLTRCIAGIDAAFAAMAGTLPITAAEAMMDGIEDNLLCARVKAARALAMLESAR